MTPAARIQSSLEVLQSIGEGLRPADALISGYFRARRYIGSHDRSALSTRIYAVLRHTARLNWWLSKHRYDATARFRLLTWLALGERLSLTQLSELCSGGKYAVPALDEFERTFLAKIEGSTLEHPDMPEDVIAECPPAAYAALKDRFGKHFLREMRAMQEPAPLDLRVNSLKADREQILKSLKELKIHAVPCTLSPWGVRVFERPSLSALAMLKNGLVEIQDEGSQMIAFLVDAKPSDRVVDFCAGAGGKTLAIGATMENKGRIVACDTIENRLKPAGDRFRRAGLHNIETRVLTTERDPWVKKHKGSFDKVLTDVPCSGIGTWRRNPDSRWRHLGPQIQDLVQTQRNILDSASRLVKPGGRLIYSTCSLLAEENENQISYFLEHHPEFSLVPCGLGGADHLVLTPAQHGTDGFFAAIMVKASQQTPAIMLD